MLDDPQAKSTVEGLDTLTPAVPVSAVFEATMDPLLDFALPEPAPRFAGLRERHGARFRRWFRYSATSVVSLGTSEATLLALLYSSAVRNATLAALIGNLAGTVPSYLLSRYWIWPEADRRRAGRQVVLYWLTSIICMAITSVATGAITNLSPKGHLLHVVIAGGAFLVFNLVLWVAKYLVYQTVIFPTSSSGRAAPMSEEQLAI